MAHSSHPTKLTQLEMSPKATYSKNQLQTYLTRICLPEKHLQSPVFSNPSLAKTKEHGLPLLDAMTRYHLGNVPFENLELHYSAHKTITLNMVNLYTKFAEKGLQYGRGGRCMENNGFFGTVLRSLGYDVRNCAGRMSRMMSPNAETREQQGHTYDGWNHMLNLVRLDDQWYVTDVGNGTYGPNLVYPLEDGYECESIAPRKIRLQRRPIPEHGAAVADEAPKLWCYDVCFAPGTAEVDAWLSTYCFTETEFLPQDYEMMSWYTSTSPNSFFTYSILCTKMLMDASGEKIIGDITLFHDTIRKTVAGTREVVKKCQTDQERVEALKDLFNIHLTPEEVSGITKEMRIQ